MPNLTATCAITGKEFTISEQEQELRAKFGLEGVLPKMSSLERIRTLAAHRILHGFWKNESIDGETLVSMFHSSTPFGIIDTDKFNSDQYAGTEYAQAIDWERPLYDQLWELWVKVPRPHHYKLQCENCDFSNNIGFSKDCYYLFGSNDSEGVYYSDNTWFAKDCFDCYNTFHIELCYYCIDCRENCYRCGYCLSCKSCTDCLGCVDCQSCQNCLLCSGLEHQKYCYRNEQLSEEEYKVKLVEYKSDWSRLKKEYEEVRTGHKYDTNINIENSSGAYLHNSRDCQRCYNVSEAENVMNALLWPQSKDCVDCFHFGVRAEMACNCAAAGFNTYYTLGCTYISENCHHLEHCHFCIKGISDCMLSVGLNKKERFCILNKQYTEEEYNGLKPRLIAKIKEEGWYGEPTPISWGNNPYNLSTAYDYLPLTKEEVENRGLRWADPEDMVSVEGAEVAGDEIVTAEDVTKLNGKVLKCERTGRPFKLIAAELSLYAKHGLPLPKLHPDERYRDRVKQTVPLESVFN